MNSMPDIHATLPGLAQLNAAQPADFLPLALLLALLAGTWFLVRAWRERRKRTAAPSEAVAIPLAATWAPSTPPVADPEPSQAVATTMQGLSDQQLQHLLAFDSGDYRPEALALARRELRTRGLPDLSPEDYWQQHMPGGRSPEGFCLQCYRQTTDATAAGLLEELGCGSGRVRLWGRRDPCGTCGSVLQTKSVFVLWFLPVAPLGRYRVLPAPLTKRGVLTRRLRER